MELNLAQDLCRQPHVGYMEVISLDPMASWTDFSSIEMLSGSTRCRTSEDISSERQNYRFGWSCRAYAYWVATPSVKFPRFIHYFIVHCIDLPRYTTLYTYIMGIIFCYLYQYTYRVNSNCTTNYATNQGVSSKSGFKFIFCSSLVFSFSERFNLATYLWVRVWK